MSGLSKILNVTRAIWFVWCAAFVFFFVATENISSAFAAAFMSVAIIGIVFAVFATLAVPILGGAPGSITILLHFALGAFCTVVGVAAAIRFDDTIVLLSTSFATIFVSFTAAAVFAHVAVNKEESFGTILCLFLPFGIGLAIGEILRRRRSRMSAQRRYK